MYAVVKNILSNILLVTLIIFIFLAIEALKHGDRASQLPFVSNIP